jgi:type III secretion protein Q
MTIFSDPLAAISRETFSTPLSCRPPASVAGDASNAGAARVMTAGAHRRFMPRRVNATMWATRRLLRTYRAELASDDGTPRQQLHLSPAGPRHADEREGLCVSTRFGHAIWFDYEALLLACTGIDVESAFTRPARVAFARYAVAALPASMHAAMGEPVVIAGPHRVPADGWIAANLRYDAAPVRLAMRLAIDADGLQAMLEDGPWRPDPVPPPAWLIALPSRHGIVAGEVTMPPHSVHCLRRGDVIPLPADAFDTTGCGHVRIFDRIARVRWLDDQRSFEVQNMSTDNNPAPPGLEAEPVPAAACVDATKLPIRLSFSLGSLQLPLGDVAAIRSGTLLRLEDGLPPRVRIEANGVPVGYGELVDLDGRLAVEITEWPHTAAESPLP